MRFFVTIPILLLIFAVGNPVSATTTALSLDGTWKIATDPENGGREARWFHTLPVEAVDIKVPGILQLAFPAYHGLVWYWSEFDELPRTDIADRYLIRFEQVDYYAEVWLNDVLVGTHEGGETPFVFDITDKIKPHDNRLAVRVLNPTHEMIDGIRLTETAKRCKNIPFHAGGGYAHGGITGSVTLLCVPATYTEDLFVDPRAEDGTVHLDLTVRNAGKETVTGTITVSISNGRNGDTLREFSEKARFPVGSSRVRLSTQVVNPQLWQLNDPFLYRATVRVKTDDVKTFHERSERFGFRDFRFSDGYFRLNGKRIYLRSTHTCNHYPIGQQFPDDPDLLRRDLINLKTMGFNMVRFIWGAATPMQLDFCDELGLMVYNESYAAWVIQESPKMKERMTYGITEVIRRDRNHPSVVIMGMLNESPAHPVFHHAVSLLPELRKLDPNRMFFLNSGRYDNAWGTPAIHEWSNKPLSEPWAARNLAASTVEALGYVWPSGVFGLHPGKDHRAVLRWTAPEVGSVEIDARFVGLATVGGVTTTDLHILHNGKELFESALNLNGNGNEAAWKQTLTVRAGDQIDFAVGNGGNSHAADSTGLVLTMRLGDRTFDAAADYSQTQNPNGAWEYGQIDMKSPVDVSKFVLFRDTKTPMGSLSNPGSSEWEDVLHDLHQYPYAPHTAEIIRALRQYGQYEPLNSAPVYLSEYGLGSSVDLIRTVRHFEQRQAEHLEDARFFRDILDRFQVEWERFKMDEIFNRPEDFFATSLEKMASQRRLGMNAVRANPYFVGYSLTGGIDHVMSGEGLTTTFRELKPGTVDALYECWAPLRWCLFAEPFHLYRGGTLRLEAVLANEDALLPGSYPVTLEVFSSEGKRMWERSLTVEIPNKKSGDKEEPFARICFDETQLFDAPAGKYRFVATFRHGAAATGGETFFYVTDPAGMPKVDKEIVLWGEDDELAQWMTEQGIRFRAFAPETASEKGEVILVSKTPASPGGRDVFTDLRKRMAAGATVIFLCPEVFADGENRLAHLPLEQKGELRRVQSDLYITDEWSKKHPIFEGLPTGGLMDYTYYSDMISFMTFIGQTTPETAVAGGFRTSLNYSGGLYLAVYPEGEGRFVINSLQIRETLGKNPAAERLLRNLLNGNW